jgi:tetratricopeptide (TPR) repeat protein
VEKIFSRQDYFYTQFRVIVTYLRLLFLPVNQNFFYDYPVYHSFFDMPVLLSFVFLAALFGLGVYLITKQVKEVPQPQPVIRLMGFGILWFFITLSVESSVIPLWMLINEYRMYLPSAGIIITVATGVSLLDNRVRGKAVFLLLAIVVVLSIATHLRNEVWQDNVKLWEDTAQKSPGKTTVHNNLGNSYAALNMTDKAIEQYLIAIKLDPYNAEAYYNLGNRYAILNMTGMAIEQYLLAVNLKPDYAEAHFNLGLLYSIMGQPENARRELENGLNIKPDDQKAQQLLQMLSH